MPACNFNMYILLVAKPVIIYNDLLFIYHAKSLEEVIIDVSCERMNKISETEMFRTIVTKSASKVRKRDSIFYDRAVRTILTVRSFHFSRNKLDSIDRRTLI